MLYSDKVYTDDVEEIVIVNIPLENDLSDEDEVENDNTLTLVQSYKKFGSASGQTV